MTIMIDVTPEEALRVEQAKNKGFDVDTMLRGIIAGLPAAEKPEDRTPEIFAQWRTEAALTPEEIGAEDEDWDEIVNNLTNRRLSFFVPDVSGHD